MIYLSAILIVALEIIADKKLWSIGKHDKPVTTIIRGLLVFIAAFLIGPSWNAIFLLVATIFLLFDFALNVSRWNDLPVPYDWKKRNGIEKTFLQKVGYQIRYFNTKFFYHGDELKSWKKFHDWYDLVFMRIPPPAELLIKGTVFGTALYFYL